MSWATVRDAVANTIEALTPGTTDVGSSAFRHVKGEQIDDVSRDRMFSVLMVSPPAHIGQTTITGRYRTDFDVVMHYTHTAYVETDQARIAEDCIQIQEALFDYANLGNDVCGIIATGEGYADTALSEDSEGNYQLTISMTVNHN